MGELGTAISILALIIIGFWIKSAENKACRSRHVRHGTDENGFGKDGKARFGRGTDTCPKPALSKLAENRRGNGKLRST